jgi:hypothetical protein
VTREAWLAKYVARLCERGLPPECAAELADQVEFCGPLGQDLEDDPAEAADDELEQMGDDEGGDRGHDY